MGVNINTVVVEGNLTRDPDLQTTGGGTSVCKMRIAVNGRRKQGEDWVDKPNFFDVTVWGSQAENCANYLSKGRGVTVQGRLDWREWETKDGSGKRQAVEIIAQHVRFSSNKGGGSSSLPSVDESDFEAAAAATSDDDDIPF